MPIRSINTTTTMYRSSYWSVRQRGVNLVFRYCTLKPHIDGAWSYWSEDFLHYNIIIDRFSFGRDGLPYKHKG